MKVLEVVTTTHIRDPHRPPLTSMSQRNEFKVIDDYGLELHPSGLAVIIRGKDHTRLAPIASAIVVEDGREPVSEVAPAKKASKR